MLRGDSMETENKLVETGARVFLQEDTEAEGLATARPLQTWSEVQEVATLVGGVGFEHLTILLWDSEANVNSLKFTSVNFL